MPKKNLSIYFICPLCQASKSRGEMVKHIAYTGDPEHQQWRMSHGFPENIAFGHHNKYEPQLRIAIVSSFTQKDRQVPGRTLYLGQK